jgi:hypothetical protein
MKRPPWKWKKPNPQECGIYLYLTEFKATFMYSRRQYCIIHNSCFLRPTIPAFSTLTYLLTPRNRILLENLTHLQLVKEFPAFYGTRKFITAFPKYPYPDPTQSNPYPHIPPPEDIACPSFVVSVVPQCKSRCETLWIFRNKGTFSRWGIFIPLSPPPSWRITPCRLSAYPPYWRLLLHPQPEDAPCLIYNLSN